MSATPQSVIVQYLVQDQSTETLNKIKQAHKDISEQVDRNDKSNRSLTESLGSVRQGIIGVSAGAFLGEEAMRAMGDSSGKAVSGLTAAKEAMHLFALAIIDPTPIGMAGAAIGFLVGMIEAQNKKEQEALKPAEDLIADLDKMKVSHDSLGVKIQQVTGLLGVEADAIAKAAGNSDNVSEKTRRLAELRNTAIQQGIEYTHQETAAYSLYTDALASGSMTTEQFNKILERLKQPLIETTKEIQDLTQSTLSESRAFNEQQRQLDILSPNILKVKDAWDKYNQTLQDLAVSHQKNIDTLKNESAAAQQTEADARIKLTESTDRQVETIELNLNKTLATDAYNYATTLSNLMYSRYQQERTLTQQLEQEAVTRTRALQNVDAQLGDQLRAAHTDREREKAELAAQVQRTAIEQQNADKIKQLAEQKANRDEDFARQKALIDEQAQRQRSSALESAAIQKQATLDAAKIQAQSIEDTLKKSLTAISDRKTAEDKAYTDAQTKAKQARNEQITLLTDTRTEQEKVNAALLTMGTYIDANTQKFIQMYNASAGNPTTAMPNQGFVTPQTSNYNNPWLGVSSSYGGLLSGGQLAGGGNQAWKSSVTNNFYISGYDTNELLAKFEQLFALQGGR